MKRFSTILSAVVAGALVASVALAAPAGHTGVRGVEHQVSSAPGRQTAAAPTQDLAASTATPTPAAPIDPVCTDVLACGPDFDAAMLLEAKAADHLYDGQMLEIDYRTPERLPGDVASGGAWGDSGLWTGTYLAAESFRYSVAKQHLAERPPADPAFWNAQKHEAKARIDEMVAKYHLNVNIAREWKTELSPAVDPNGGDPKVSYGGGIVQGEPGMLMRSCAPTDGPAGFQMGPNKRVFGPFEWEDGREYMCETAPSRDTYAGTTFGLLTAFDLVGPDDKAMRQQIAADILTLANFLVKHGWMFPRPHGNVNIPVGEQKVNGTHVPLTGHDFDSPLSANYFLQVPMARLNLTQGARHVADVAGTAVDKAQWNAVWAEELASQGPLLAGSMEVDALQPNDGYYKYNLHHLTGFSLTRLEPDPTVASLFRQAIGVMDHTTGDDINAHFETITYALTGEPSRRAAAIEHLGQWLDYRHAVETGTLPITKARCATDLECVPKDQYDWTVGGQTATIPGTSTEMRARLPLPVAQRPATDFLWQRPPTQLTDHQDGATHEAPGIDYLLPYWMLRYYSEVTKPALQPFPAWPGPAHS